jgi:hypothetical protein
MVWRGVLLKQSLEDEELLKLVHILKKDISMLEKEFRIITFYNIEVEDSKKEEFVQKAIKAIKPKFYIHIVKDGVMYVIFKDKMFKFRKNDPQLNEAREYGKSIGIIPEQMLFEHLIDHPFD